MCGRRCILRVCCRRCILRAGTALTQPPHDLPIAASLEPDEYYDKLEKARKQYEERQSRKAGQPVQFQSAGKLEATKTAASISSSAAPAPAPAPPPTASADVPPPKRKSKWDTGPSKVPRPS